MIKYFKKITGIKNKEQAFFQAGMTYVELIVVLAIFAALSSVVMFNYGSFQARVNIKNLASDIALKLVEAQKSSISGRLPPAAQYALIPSPVTWKPSYGVYMGDAFSFVYFTDLNQDNLIANPTCAGTSECLDKITITKGNFISNLEVTGTGTGCQTTATSITVSFKRPDSRAIIKLGGVPGTCIISSIRIKISSPEGSFAYITVYPSGRIQVN